MGAREGTEPEDDPLTRSISLKAQARGRSEMLAANVLTVLKAGPFIHLRRMTKALFTLE